MRASEGLGEVDKLSRPSIFQQQESGDEEIHPGPMTDIAVRVQCGPSRTCTQMGLGKRLGTYSELSGWGRGDLNRNQQAQELQGLVVDTFRSGLVNLSSIHTTRQQGCLENAPKLQLSNWCGEIVSNSHLLLADVYDVCRTTFYVRTVSLIHNALPWR